MIHDTASPLPHYTVFATPLLSELELHPIRRRGKMVQKYTENVFKYKVLNIRPNYIFWTLLI
jgi:hypothetical protein